MKNRTQGVPRDPAITARIDQLPGGKLVVRIELVDPSRPDSWRYPQTMTYVSVPLVSLGRHGLFDLLIAALVDCHRQLWDDDPLAALPPQWQSHAVRWPVPPKGGRGVPSHRAPEQDPLF